MPHDGHPDEVHTLRFALWGPVDDATREAGCHVADDECAPCARSVATWRAAQSALRGTTSPDRTVLEAVRRAGRRAAEPQFESLDWLHAEPAPLAGGVRSGLTADRQLVCTVGEHHLDVLLHPAGQDGVFAVSGQLLDRLDLPAVGLVVSLLVDAQPRATTRTNGFGEFEFDDHQGRHFGVRLGTGASARHVELWTAEGLR